VTLSSLNRHATATRDDVGTPKATALRKALLRVEPTADIEAVVALFDDAAAARLLDGSPALVIDAIDDLATKVALLGHCVRAGLPVLCALGAGGKADACALHVGRLSEVFNDPIAASMLKRLRKQKQLGMKAKSATAAAAPIAAAADADGAPLAAPPDAPTAKSTELEPEWWWNDMEHRVTVVYSSEQQRVSLLPLPEKTAAAELGSQPNFRVRVMPVLPPLPAAVGAALAARGLAQLSGVRVEPFARPVPALSSAYLMRLHRNFLKHELGELKRPASEVTLAYFEAALLVCDVFRCRCAFTGRRLHDPARPTFCLVRFDASRDADASNVLFAVSEAAERHEREGIDALPAPLRCQIQQTIADGLGGREESVLSAERRRAHTPQSNH
jgi:tRNA A37 threonylcarbamoyladenosine dehydratase